MRACVKAKEIARLKEMFEWLELFEMCEYKSIKNRPFMFDAKTKIIMA
jgi:hypothetical protein